MLTKVQSNCGGMGSALAVITLFKSSVSSAKLCMCNLKHVLQSNCSLEIFCINCHILAATKNREKNVAMEWLIRVIGDFLISSYLIEVLDLSVVGGFLIGSYLNQKKDQS